MFQGPCVRPEWISQVITHIEAIGARHWRRLLDAVRDLGADQFLEWVVLHQQIFRVFDVIDRALESER